MPHCIMKMRKGLQRLPAEAFVLESVTFMEDRSYEKQRRINE